MRYGYTSIRRRCVRTTWRMSDNVYCLETEATRGVCVLYARVARGGGVCVYTCCGMMWQENENKWNAGTHQIIIRPPKQNENKNEPPQLGNTANVCSSLDLPPLIYSPILIEFLVFLATIRNQNRHKFGSMRRGCGRGSWSIVASSRHWSPNGKFSDCITVAPKISAISSLSLCLFIFSALQPSISLCLSLSLASLSLSLFVRF